MKKWLLLGLALAATAIGWWYLKPGNGGIVNPLGTPEPPARPYAKYTFANLAKRGGMPSQIERGEEIAHSPGYISYLFFYRSEGGRISGQLNLPETAKSEKSPKIPVVVMVRGYVEKEMYQTGVGTKNAAAYFAKHGYITLAPDFSGYGQSDPEDPDAIGARLSKPAEILDLLASIRNVPGADPSRVFVWGHSNGGQIALSLAEILGLSGKDPGITLKGITLWAPVSKPFPYSILYYTDEADDQGKWLRREVAQFEEKYDVYDYSLDRNWDSIKIPLQWHQGTADEAVPRKWSDEAVATLTKKGKDITYWVYPGADHNLSPGWDSAVERDLAFFGKL